jgi:hypothetical protein
MTGNDADAAGPTEITGRDTAELLQRAVDNPVTVLGTYTSPHAKRDLIAIPDADRYEHVYCGGPTGSGKTVLMQHAILQDIAKDHSVVVLNPKGDMIDDLLGKLPDARLTDVTYLQPAQDHVPALNILEPHNVNALSATQRDTQVSLLVGTVLDMFRRQSQYWGDRFGRLLAAVLRALIQDNIAIKRGDRPGNLNTLADVAHVLQDDDALRDLIDRTDDGILRQTLVTIRDDFDHRELEPILRRLTDFLAPTALQDVLTASTSDINLQELLDTGGILLVDVRAGEVSSQVADLLGTIVLAQVWTAAQARITQPPAQRHPAMVYVDELPLFAGNGTDLETMLAQAREYNVGCWLAAQAITQLPGRVQDEIVQNTRTKVVFPAQQGEDGNNRVLTGLPDQPITTAKQRKYRAVVQRIDQPVIAADSLPPWPANPTTIADRRQQVHAQEPEHTNDHDTTSADTDEESSTATGDAAVDATSADTLPVPDEDVPVNLGHPAVAGHDTHQALLAVAKHFFEQVYGLTVDRVYQEGGRENPDARIHLGTTGTKWFLEAECGTISKPAKVLQNLRRSHHAEDVAGAVFITTTDAADRLANILTDPVNRNGTEHTDQHGTYSYYQAADGPVTDIETLHAARFRVYAASDVGLIPVTRRK